MDPATQQHQPDTEHHPPGHPNERLGEEAQRDRRIQTHQTKNIDWENIACIPARLEGFIRLVQNSLDSERGLPSQVKGARTQPCKDRLRNAKLRTSSRRGSWVQIPPPAPVASQSSSSPKISFQGRWLAF